MTSRIAIIGSGPTGIYTLSGLMRSELPVSVTIFEAEADAGKGTPYHPDINDQSMLANIASIELPAICESLVQWLRRQPDAELQRLNVARAMISEREFYPRVVLGEYLQSQFLEVIAGGVSKGHTVEIRARHRVIDIELQHDDIRLSVTGPDGDRKDYAFDHVVMATGHNWPESTEVKPRYFMSPWPAPGLKKIEAGSVGILGTSLSAIDALITVSTAHGAFYLEPGGQLQYQQAIGGEGLHATMMSRKGLLPEADFYCDYPYKPLQVCTDEAVHSLIARGSADLLDSIFDLFKQELTSADPDYAASIGLALLSVDTLAPAYFAAREEVDPFTWAAANLAEAEQNKVNRHTVPWRYAILRMHEVIARAVPHLDQNDLKRFHGKFKSVFVDDYATVPHQSIQRLLALRRAGKLDILALGNDYEIGTEGIDRGARVRMRKEEIRFDSFIDATGQASMSARDLPFPSLVAQGVIKRATTPDGGLIASGETEEAIIRTGGVDLDAAFRPQFREGFSNRLYCAAISFLLHKLPFVQGITGSHEIGQIVSRAILDDIGGSGHMIIQTEDAAFSGVTRA
jgi:uncharacterized NAD(P)/FAD-binding protein YdhS